MTTNGSAVEKQHGVQVIARVAEVMRQLAMEPGGLTSREVSVRVGLPRSTTHRITSALCREGFVRTSQSGRLQIGPAIFGFSASTQRSLKEEVAPYLLRLSHRLNETVDLAVLEGYDVLFIDECVPARDLRVVSQIGARFPAHCTANGKALLAALPDEVLEDLLPERLTSLTPHTITDRRALLAELAHVRDHGVAYDLEEHSLGIAAAGIVIRDSMGASASMTVVAPVARFRADRRRITECLLQTRLDVHRLLIGRDAVPQMAS